MAVFVASWRRATGTLVADALGLAICVVTLLDSGNHAWWLGIALALLFGMSALVTALQGRLEFSDLGIRLSGTGKRYFRREFVLWTDVTAVTREDMGIGPVLIARMQILIHTRARKYVIMAGLYSKKDLAAITAILKRFPGAEL